MTAGTKYILSMILAFADLGGITNTYPQVAIELDLNGNQLNAIDFNTVGNSTTGETY